MTTHHIFTGTTIINTSCGQVLLSDPQIAFLSNLFPDLDTQAAAERLAVACAISFTTIESVLSLVTEAPFTY